MNKEQKTKFIPEPLLRLTAIGLLAVGCGGRLPTPTVDASKPKTEVTSTVTVKPETKPTNTPSKPTETPVKPTAVPTPVITLKVPDSNAYVSRFSANEITVHTKDTTGSGDKNLPEAIRYMLEYNCNIENIRADSFRFWRVNLKNPETCLVFKAPEGLPNNGKRYREEINGDYTRILRVGREDFIVYANSTSEGADAYIPDGLIHLQRVGCELKSYFPLSYRVLLVGVKDSNSCALHLSYD